MFKIYMLTAILTVKRITFVVGFSGQGRMAIIDLESALIILEM
jgi:hypothetical protein